MAKLLTQEAYLKLKNGTAAKSKEGEVLNKDYYDMLTGLARFYDEYKGQMVTVSQFQLAPDMSQPNKPYSLKFKTPKRSRMVITAEEFVKVNESFWNCGKWYELEEEGTEKNQSERSNQIKARSTFEKKRKVATRAVIEALGDAGEAGAKKVEILFGVDKSFEPFEDVQEEDKDLYIFIGTEDECVEYIKKNKPAAPKKEKVYGVNKKLELYEGIKPAEEKKYIKLGTKKECADFIKEQKASK